MNSPDIHIHVSLKSWPGVGSHKMRYKSNKRVCKYIYIWTWLLPPYVFIWDCSFFVPRTLSVNQKIQQIYNCRIYMIPPTVRIHIWLHSVYLFKLFIPYWIFHNHGMNCKEDMVCARCDQFPDQDRDLLMWKSTRVGKRVGENCPPRSSMLGFEVVIFWTWKCCFRRLNGWFSKFYIQQRHQDCLMLQSARGRPRGSESGQPWSSVLGFKTLDGSDLECLVLDVDLVISEDPQSSTSLSGGGNLILMQYMVKTCNELVKYRLKFLHFLINLIFFGINQR